MYAKAFSYGVHLTVFSFYCFLGMGLTLSKSDVEIGLFRMMNMFYPPKGLCESRTQWDPFDIITILLYLEKVVDTFKISNFRLHF